MSTGPWRSGVTAGPAWSAAGSSSWILAAILLLLGFVGLLFADVFTVASIVGFGVFLVAGGLTELAHAFLKRGGGDRFFVAFLSGLLSMAVGITLISRPAVGVTSAGLLVGAWLFASGLFRGATAVRDRYRNWGFDLLYGVLSILLGFWVTGRLPHSAMWLLGTAVSIELIIRAVAVMGASVNPGRREPAAATG